MLILGLNKTTLLDYPGRVAATVFTGGCNFRCPFCHNADLVLKPSLVERYTEEEIFAFLEKRRGILKGVCVTGGEPCIQADLPEFLKKIKGMGYLVKLDTNGYMPAVLNGLLEQKLLDYVAMDVKNCKEKYAQTAGFLPGKADCPYAGKESAKGKRKDPALAEKEVFCLERIEESMKILKQSGIDYEFRTTVVRELHTKEDIVKIGEWLAGCPHYFLQQYQDNEKVINKVLTSGKPLHQETSCREAEKREEKDTGSREEKDTELLHGYHRKEMEEMEKALKELPGMTGEVALRGVD